MMNISNNTHNFFDKQKADDFVYATIKAYKDDEGWYINPFFEVYYLPVKCAKEDTNDAIYNLLKPDLIDGEDRFLVSTYDHTEDHFCFNMFVYNVSYDPKSDKEILVYYAYQLAQAIAEDNITESSVITFK